MENERNYQQISTIFFDLDNTLISTRKADKLVCNKLSQILWEKYAVPLEVASLACKIFLKAFRQCPENVTMSLDSWRRLLWTQALGPQYHQLADEIYGIWLKLRYEYLQLTPEIKNLLHKLRQHYLIGLITNGTSCAQWEKINRLKLRNYFDIILVSGDLPWEKPHKKIFHEACKYLDVQPEQCLMIGDKLETDILGGITANLGGTIWVPLNYNHHNHHHNHNNLRPDYIINDVIELLDLLPDKSKKLQQYSMLDFDDGSSNSSDGS